jgi:AraC family transcriptional regulator, transcriptional activator of pobA
MASPAIPTFALYGEDQWPSPAGFAHIETIAARSTLYDWAIAPHRHDRAVQLLLVHRGPADVSLDGTHFAFAGPGWLIVPPGVVHGFRFGHGTTGHVLTLSQEFTRRAQRPGDALAALLTRGGNGLLSPKAAGRAERLADELIALGDDGATSDGTDDALFEAMAEALLRTLAGDDDRGAAGVPDDRRLAVFRHMVETHLAEHRPLEFYARSIGTTVRTLTRLTQRHLGQSPQMLINRRLALEAQRLLRYTGASASAVAAELGFADPSYFSRFYLRMTGHRPQEERGPR